MRYGKSVLEVVGISGHRIFFGQVESADPLGFDWLAREVKSLNKIMVSLAKVAVESVEMCSLRKGLDSSTES